MATILVVPNGIVVSVAFTSVTGSSVTVYSDDAYQTEVTQPVSISAATTYHTQTLGAVRVVASDREGTALADKWVDTRKSGAFVDVAPERSYLSRLANLRPGANSVIARVGSAAAAPVTLPEGTLLGRVSGGDVAALTAAEVATVLGLVSPNKSGAIVMPLIFLSATSYSEGSFFGFPLPVFASGTLDRIGCEITEPGSAGAVVRLGIYRLDENGVDVTLVLDAGTVDGTQAAGTYSIAISQAVTPGVYVIGGAIQGGATTRPSLRYGLSTTPHFISRTTALGAAASQGMAFVAAGALPSTATPVDVQSAPAIYVRWA